MKKIMMLLMLSGFFFMGGMSESMAQYLKKDVTLSPGDTFYVSFQNITDGSKSIALWIKRQGGQRPEAYYLGSVSAYALCCLEQEDEGIYYFAVYENGTWIFKMEVHLTVRGSIMFTSVACMNKPVNESGGNLSKLSPIYIQEKSLRWRSKMMILV